MSNKTVVRAICRDYTEQWECQQSQRQRRINVENNHGVWKCQGLNVKEMYSEGNTNTTF